MRSGVVRLPVFGEAEGKEGRAPPPAGAASSRPMRWRLGAGSPRGAKKGAMELQDRCPVRPHGNAGEAGTDGPSSFLDELLGKSVCFLGERRSARGFASRVFPRVQFCEASWMCPRWWCSVWWTAPPLYAPKYMVSPNHQTARSLLRTTRSCAAPDEVWRERTGLRERSRIHCSSRPVPRPRILPLPALFAQSKSTKRACTNFSW